VDTAALPIDHLTLLLDSTGEGIFGIDMDGRCTFVNRAACEPLGWRTEAVLGRNMHELIHHSHADGRHYPACDCPIFNAFRRGLPCRIDDEVLWCADGTSFPAEYSSHPVIEGGQVRGAVVTFVDIGQRKRAEELLRKSRDELELRVAERTLQLRELANHVEAMRETERKRIAREIHATLHHDPQYYCIRNHLVDFLVSRSAELSHGRAPAVPPEVSPGLAEPDPEPAAPAAGAHPVIPFRRSA
jgi:PAS domain S-box-containing protein